VAFPLQTFSKITSGGKIMIDDTNPTLHHLSPSKINSNISIPWKGFSSLLIESILQDHLVNDLSTKDASPSEKLFTNTIEFFEDHGSATTMTLHKKPPIVKFR
jgi:hypothetical protein